MADKDLDPSLSRDSFPPDGQVQSEAAKTQQGHSDKTTVITVPVQEPSPDDDERYRELEEVLFRDHQEVQHEDLSPSQTKPAKKKSAPKQAPKPK